MNGSPANEIGQHVGRMYRVALRLVADADAAHDVVQEACLKALAGMGEFDGRASLATWLHRITVNLALSAGRSEHRKQAAYAVAGEHQRVRQAAPEQSSPADIAESRELFSLAWELVDRLPEDCRSAFVLTQLDGYSYDEAAEIEGQPRGTMASRVFRAKKILQEQMNARTGTGPILGRFQNGDCPQRSMVKGQSPFSDTAPKKGDSPSGRANQ